MPKGDHSRPSRALRVVPVGVVVLLLAAGVAALALDLRLPFSKAPAPSPVTRPAAVAPPPGLRLPTVGRSAVVATPTPNRGVDPAAVAVAVRRLLARPQLGRRVALDVAQLSDGRTVFRAGPSRVTPASTMKLLTTTAALEALGPEHRFTTSVVSGRRPGRVMLVGGGDPLLARAPAEGYPRQATIRSLARRTASALAQQGRRRVSVAYDASLFAGPAVNPRWESSYVPDGVVSPISALWVDEGRSRNGYGHDANPAAAAADAFRSALERHGITVRGRSRAAVAPAGADVLATVSSAPLAQIVEHVLEVSDNEGAEVLARQTALATGRPASFTGAVTAVRRVLQSLGVSTAGDRIYDGSGLSRAARLRPATLLDVIELAAGRGDGALRPVVTDVPVAGFTGSLALRFDTGKPLGLGTVRAKTGTLTGVHALAGTVTSRDGAVMGFVAVADRVRLRDNLEARDLLDRIAASLAGCRCSSTP